MTRMFSSWIRPALASVPRRTRLRFVGGALALFAAALVVQPEPAVADETIKSIDRIELPTEPSKRPTVAEWATAPKVALTRVSPNLTGCQAFLLREWLKVRCAGMPLAAFSLLGGERNDVLMWITPAKEPTEPPSSGEVIFPLRKGEVRVLGGWTFGEGYDGPLTVLPAFVLQEDWREDTPAAGHQGPIVTLF
jgi:hypothetical protein